MKLKLITTSDGSHSLLREDLNETYHSFHGAMGESLYVFIQQGLDYLLHEKSLISLKIFEVGFGTGLNAFLSALWAERNQCRVEFYTVEPFPVPAAIYQQFNYGQNAEEQKLLQVIHDAPWGEQVEISSAFLLHKYKTTLQEFSGPAGFDVLFFDAFAPSKQSELWELPVINKCADLLRSGGILTTYCAQGQFKRNLTASGLEVQTLKGAMGKKEMVRARKPSQ